MNLSLLPSIVFCETDTAAVEAAVIASYEEITEKSLYPGSPERLFIEAVAYLIAQQNFVIDYTGKMNLLSLSTGDFLDHLGALLNTNRLGSAYATTSLTFTLGEPLTWQVVIPQGTRATPDGEVYFATDMDATIPAGDMSVTVPATCVEAGAKHNGLLAGQINALVDRVAYVATVANSIITLGGTDIENDDRLRSRIQLAPERLSTCGPENAYRYWALSVSPDILDVAVWSPEAGQIWVAPLMTGGDLPGSEILSKILAAISTKDRRPLTDELNVTSPEAVSYSIAGTYWIRTSYASRGGSIQAQIAAALGGYQTWQKAKLGRDILPSELISRIQSIEGVQRVELSAPGYTALDPWQVAQCSAASLNYGGLSDD